MKTNHRRDRRHETGAVLVFVALSMIVLMGIAALAIDVGYLYVVRGELQNAADSGALAAAQNLYNASGTAVNTGANQIGLNYVEKHIADADKATAAIATDCTNDIANQLGGKCVERGHWSFQTRTFTPNSSTAAVSLVGVSTTALDGNPDFINAVRVITTRRASGDGSRALNEPWLARTFGGVGPVLRATAVAYIGFAGTLKPHEVNQPIAICKQSLVDNNGVFTCGVGRMINSGTTESHQSGGCPDFTQFPCTTASANDVRPLVSCALTGNPRTITLGADMGTTGGQLQSAYDDMLGCWSTNPNLDVFKQDPPASGTWVQVPPGGGDGVVDQPWTMKLPVIDCPDPNVRPCSTVVGSVTVDVVWISRTGDTSGANAYSEVPRKFETWSCPASKTGQECWASFTDAFGLKLIDQSNNMLPAPYQDKTIYFKPSCDVAIPSGVTGGQNFGVLAQIPVLVR